MSPLGRDSSRMAARPGRRSDVREATSRKRVSRPTYTVPLPGNVLSSRASFNARQKPLLRRCKADARCAAPPLGGAHIPSAQQQRPSEAPTSLPSECRLAPSACRRRCPKDNCSSAPSAEHSLRKQRRVDGRVGLAVCDRPGGQKARLGGWEARRLGGAPSDVCNASKKNALLMGAPFPEITLITSEATTPPTMAHTGASSASACRPTCSSQTGDTLLQPGGATHITRRAAWPPALPP